MAHCRFIVTIVWLVFAGGALAAEPAKPKIVVEVDASSVPELKEWTDKAAATVTDFYPTIVEQLGDEGYTPPAKVPLIVKADMKGVAATAGNTIFLAPEWFKHHPDDVGAVVHEMCHVVQAYQRRRPPGWVTEGIADYVRWFVYEPANRRPRVNPDQAKYTDSYRTTAAFFDWIVRTKDPSFVKRLNIACRAGKYDAALFKEYAGASVDELWDQFIESVGTK